MILATFADPSALARAVQALHAAGVREVETHTPAPPADAEGPSIIPLVMLLAGLVGAFAGFLLQSYAQAVSYRIDIGGRPYLFWPAYIPFAFETGAGTAVVAGFIAFLVLNNLPRLYDGIDESESLAGATRDAWLVAVRSGDAREIAQARACLASLAPLSTEELDA